ncbi:hypothetical protein CAOG_04726 [Capsaspora owczarzaki ATCC 30864]|uniref:hypothetical protein n=1 Tax=Capsaspora owczarzaki (strain ATCC 30864) TaxID=595528 RepID=UPI0001FE3C00|nr:hypothetical protein CAOG_04726 [Capsaspora owczarzaki ATCC 30864]|eukprot:XP_004347473.1 hypothetical protein CAOG_04726 [Capsaspora owczarzaki ATCC 30864]
MTTRRRRGTVLAALVVAVIFIYVALLQGFNGHQNDAVKVTEALWEPEVATTQATIQPEFSEPVAMQPMPVSQPTRDLLQVIDPTAQAAKSSVVVNDQDDELEVEEEAAQQDPMIEVGASPQPADRVCIGSPAFNASELETVPQAVQCLLESPRFYPVLFGFSQQSETTTSLFNTFLEQGKFRLTIDRREVDITTPIDWHMNPFKDRTWQMWFHSWKELVGLPLFEYKSHPDRPELVRFAKVFALDWCEKFGATRPERFASIPKGKEGDPQFPIKAYLWYDMAVSSRATQLINLLRLGAHAGPDYLSETEFAALAACQLEHAYYLAANDTYAWYNHGLFSDMSLFFISRDLPWLHPNTTAWGDLAIYRFGANAGASIDVASGMHLEHSVSYQSAMINLLTVADEANVLGHTSLGADILQKMRRALVWMLTTDDEQSMPLVGDTSAEEFAHRAQYEHEDGLAPAIMNKGGAAIVKQLSTRSHLFMVAWFHSCTHKHADELSFVLTEFGRQLVVDLGKLTTE